jgi:hypothetical protein
MHLLSRKRLTKTTTAAPRGLALPSPGRVGYLKIGYLGWSQAAAGWTFGSIGWVFATLGAG